MTTRMILAMKENSDEGDEGESALKVVSLFRLGGVERLSENLLLTGPRLLNRFCNTPTIRPEPRVRGDGPDRGGPIRGTSRRARFGSPLLPIDECELPAPDSRPVPPSCLATGR